MFSINEYCQQLTLLNKLSGDNSKLTKKIENWTKCPLVTPLQSNPKVIKISGILLQKIFN